MDFDIDAFLGLDPDPVTPDATDQESDLVTSAVIAAWLGLSTTRITQLAADGVLQRVTIRGRNYFPHRATVLAYIETQRSAAARRAEAPELAAAKLALTEANARKVELQNDKASGDLLPVALVRNEWLGIITDIRSRLLAVPQRVAANLGLDRAVSASIDKEIRAAMADMVADATEPPEICPVAGDSTPTHTNPAQTQDASLGAFL